MARKTFISYKYSEAVDIRDRIIEKLGEDGKYYQGETSEYPDLSDKRTEYIRDRLKDMIYSTSVLILIISPNMKDSDWVEWEVSYALKEIKRGDRKSKSNGVVGVVMEYNGGYDWLITNKVNSDGCSMRNVDSSKLIDLVNKNRFNLNKENYCCTKCKTVDILEGSYISLIKEEDFLKDPQKYIENAYSKSQNIDSFNMTKALKEKAF